VDSAELGERGALALVAGRAEDLNILGGRGASHRDRNDVVVLDLEAGIAFKAATTISLEDRKSDLTWNRLPVLRARLRCRHAGSSALKASVLAPLAVADECENIVGAEIFVVGVDPALE
jgi:hypothetical protein